MNRGAVNSAAAVGFQAVLESMVGSEVGSLAAV